jgi:hypothetical protein
MDSKNLYLKTLIAEFPYIYSYNNQALKRYLDLFYNEAGQLIIAPVNTPGRVKAATGEFVNLITDNLTVKKQWTNWYENTTTVDQDYYNTLIGPDTSTRDASTWEVGTYRYVDVMKPYYKIDNSFGYAFSCPAMGQEFQVIFDTDNSHPTDVYNILIDPIGGYYYTATVADKELAWARFIAVAWDPSYGTTWKVKESAYGDIFQIS